MSTGEKCLPNNKPFLFPMKRLFYSRKFMVLLLDVIISTILYFVGKYSVSGIADDIGFLIGSYQPVVLMMIYTIAKEDVAAISSPGVINNISG